MRQMTQRERLLAYEQRPANFLMVIDRNYADKNAYYNLIIPSKLDNKSKFKARDIAIELTVVAMLDAFCDIYKMIFGRRV